MPRSISASSEDTEEFNDEDVSVHNDGRGLQITVILVQQLPPLKTGEKRRANAKPPTIKAIAYVHEDNGLIQSLYQIIGTSLDRRDLCKGGLDDKKRLSEETPFTLEASVPRNTGFKDIAIRGEEDWELFVEAMEKRSQGSLLVREKPSEEDIVTQDDRNEAEQHAEDDDEVEAPTQPTRKKKKKVHVPTEEEEAETSNIEMLSKKYACEDRKCSSTICWVHPESEAHIKLTSLHLRTWATAIEAKQEGVDEDSPPNAKIFDPAADVNKQLSSDVALMARRRANANTTSSGSTVIVNLDGLAEVMRATSGSAGSTANAPAMAAPPVEQAKRSIDVTKWPKIDLRTFCDKFDLSDALYMKLDNIGVTGPHSLRFIKDDELRTDGKFLLGELGDLRDAEQRWTNHCTWDD